MPNQNHSGNSIPEEEREKIERMNRIRQSMANAGDSQNAAGVRKPQTKTAMLDVSVADRPPQEQGSEATRAQKLAQIREALAMVEKPAVQPQPVPAKKGALPPLKKKGSKSAIRQNAAAETVVTTPPPKKSPPPVQQKTKSAAKPAPKQKKAEAPAPQKPASVSEPPKKAAPQQEPAPVQKDAPQQNKPAVQKQPLPPLKKAGTKGKAAENAAAETVVLAVKPESKAPKKKAEVHKTTKSSEPAVKQKPVTEKKPEPVKAPEKKPVPAKPKPAKAASAAVPVGKISAIFVGGLAALVLIVYAVMVFFFNDKFLPNTFINGVAVGNMTQQEATDVLLSKVKTDDLVLVTAQGDQVAVEARKYEAEYSIPAGAMDEAFAENKLLWIKKLFANSEYTMEYDFSYSEEKLREQIVDHDWGSEVSQNAYIQRGADGMYEIVPATTGNQFDKNKLMNFVTEQLKVGRFMVNMEESGCYEAFAAEVQAEDLQEKLEICNKFAQCTITYDFYDRTEVLEGATIAEWVILDENSNISFNRAELEKFVAAMADKYDTYGRDRTFRSTLDGTITVPWTSTSMYGWQIDQEETVEELYALLEACESATVEPSYTGWGYGYTRAENDIGGTYVEVDISAQHVWFYKGGVLQMDSDCVTGTETDPNRRTPRGIFEIWSHEEDRVLGQMDDEGYETPVNYWMPINYIGVGLHDLGRGAYGGSIYMYNGSHGCINLPLSFARDLFYATENGIPVVIHE
ncbi:MAG: peptidoglycan binding domain-containing protein [Oscillospiraceae bacterium]|nr:peptidoglycan binding domain-containing protein [Oscillospiraceae bacterium]